LKSEIGKNFLSSDKNLNVIIHNIKAKTISVDGKPVVFKTNKTIVILPVTWNKGSEKEIKIQL
jgi:predicted ribosome-associated RNA-binding protein Tma20